jgi:hypothetical protein
VFVTKLAVVLAEIHELTPGRPLGSSGRWLWSRRSAYRRTANTAMKATASVAYVFHPCSSSARVPRRRRKPRSGAVTQRGSRSVPE